MQFSDISFVLKFLPLFLMVYYIVPTKFRNFTVIAGSILYYGFAGREYLPAVLLSLFINYFFAKNLHRSPKVLLTISVSMNLAILISCKAFGIAIPGASFIIFEMIALMADIYHKRTEVSGFGEFTVYATFFPKVISGPIVKYESMRADYRNRTFSLNNVEAGLADFLLGLGYKVLLANRLAGVWRGIESIGVNAISTPMAWLGVLAYSLQLFFDFQGYSLMAIGLGKMLGFKLPENFDAPYCAQSVSIFFRRWHMTLGQWFKDYVYFPMGGSRRSKARTVFNLLVVWFLTGLWHGFRLHFLLWGMCICTFIILEKLFWGKWLERSKVFSHLYVCTVIPLSWLFFVLPSLADIKTYFIRLFLPFLNQAMGNVHEGEYLKYLKNYGIFLLIGIVFALPWPEKYIRKHTHKWWVIAFLAAILWGAFYFLRMDLNNPFLYSLF